MKRIVSIAITVIVLAGCGSQGGSPSGQEGVSPKPSKPDGDIRPDGGVRPGEEVQPDDKVRPDGEMPLGEPVVLMWERPDRRENGDYLEGDDISGYEVRYKKVDSSDYVTLAIDDGWAESYRFERLVGDYRFEIATVDRAGLYSDFVELQPY